jgi:hypothetical protein
MELKMRVISTSEIENVSGATVMGDTAAFFAGAAAVAGGLASVPTPASPALAGFAVITGVLSAGAWYLDSHYAS